MNNSLSIRLIVFTFFILWFQSLFGFSPWKPDIVIYGDSCECVIFKYLDGTNDTIFLSQITHISISILEAHLNVVIIQIQNIKEGN